MARALHHRRGELDHHGARATIGTFGWAGSDAWASEVEHRNGRYYWYTSVNGNGPGWMNTASTSHVSAWESLAAINNGGVPTSSADRGNLAYGNWPQHGAQWIEYRWPNAQNINRTATYWFDDNQGIDLPASCRVQYWNGGAYVDAPNQSTCSVAGEATPPATRCRPSTTPRAAAPTSGWTGCWPARATTRAAPG
ncbi:hypothetical protein [Micromonospora craniellae]|uniref:hypothetical protein n=1 Tax=Micromonospora craniellae TaxID=2294034 RepID=UPI00168BF7EA|nr:hypothetical protein [Micromonospora craniellae]QOC91591.1 hypothetical protein ID554_27200 [Micromonospora craniellae]